jgi:phospholipid-translocating ATPase
MLLWIIVYSFFQSSDFNDEVIVLFGNLDFWTAIVFSVFVALGERPRTLFLSQSNGFK